MDNHNAGRNLNLGLSHRDNPFEKMLAQENRQNEVTIVSWQHCEGYVGFWPQFIKVFVRPTTSATNYNLSPPGTLDQDDNLNSAIKNSINDDHKSPNLPNLDNLVMKPTGRKRYSLKALEDPNIPPEVKKQMLEEKRLRINNNSANYRDRKLQKIKDSEAKIQELEGENDNLKKRIVKLETQLNMFKKLFPNVDDEETTDLDEHDRNKP